MFNKLLIAFFMVMNLLPVISYGQGKSGANIQQKGDSLSLNSVIDQVISTYPSILQIEEALKIADAKIELARSGNYPEIDISASYARVDPITKISFPGFGTFQMNPENNYNAALNYNQVIYDFGRTKKSVELEKENKELILKNISDARQKIVMGLIKNYYAIVFLNEAIKIKNEELSTLRQHLDFVVKKNEAGTATQYEILSTNVKISNVESQKIDLESAMEVQVSIMKSFLGKSDPGPVNVKKDLKTELVIVPYDSLIVYALANREEIKISEEKSKLAEMNYNLIKGQNYPVVSLFANAGGKNGYIPDLDVIKPNYVAGLALKVPIYDGSRKKNNLLISNSNINNLKLETELVKRNITNEITESSSDLKASLKKTDQNEKQLSQAEKAYNLAETSYNSGVITNLDLLDASTNVSEAKLMLLKSKIDNVVCNYRLRSALGIKLYNSPRNQ